MIGLSFAILRWLFPLRPIDGSEAPLTDAERRIYLRWESGALLLFFVFAPSLGFAWYVGLKELADLFHRATPETRFLVRPTPIFWKLPAMFLGMITSAVPMEWLYLCLLGDRYRRYERSCNERAGYDARRVLSWFALLIAIGSTVGFLACVTSYARFDEDGVEIGRSLDIRGAFYKYERIEAIEHRRTFRAPNGMTCRCPHYVIVFDDGTSWSTRDGFRDPTSERDGRIARLVAQKSGRSIVEQP